MDAVVIDNGSGTIKAGFSGDKAPRFVIPTIIGRPRHQGVMVGMGQKEFYVGDEAVKNRGILTLKRPVESGVVKNWDDMEAIWSDVLDAKLKTGFGSSNPVLVTDCTANQRAYREKAVQIMFESFMIPQFALVDQAILALYASGRTTGLMFDVGYNMSRTVAINDGAIVAGTYSGYDVGGCDLTHYMMEILNERGYSFRTAEEVEICADIKEKLSYVAYDYDAELEKTRGSRVAERTYELPDGQMIDVNTERFRCPETFFKPSFIGSESDGVDELIYSAIKRAPSGLKQTLYGNIVMAGGSTLINGFSNRLAKDVKNLAPPSMAISVTQSGQYSAFVGGSIFCSTGLAPFISNLEYDDEGPSIVHRRRSSRSRL